MNYPGNWMNSLDMECPHCRDLTLLTFVTRRSPASSGLKNGKTPTSSTVLSDVSITFRVDIILPQGPFLQIFKNKEP